jgi:hypothetical protein
MAVHDELARLNQYQEDDSRLRLWEERERCANPSLIK